MDSDENRSTAPSAEAQLWEERAGLFRTATAALMAIEQTGFQGQLQAAFDAIESKSRACYVSMATEVLGNLDPQTKTIIKRLIVTTAQAGINVMPGQPELGAIEVPRLDEWRIPDDGTLLDVPTHPAVHRGMTLMEGCNLTFANRHAMFPSPGVRQPLLTITTAKKATESVVAQQLILLLARACETEAPGYNPFAKALNRSYKSSPSLEDLAMKEVQFTPTRFGQYTLISVETTPSIALMLERFVSAESQKLAWFRTADGPFELDDRDRALPYPPTFEPDPAERPTEQPPSIADSFVL